VSEREALQLVRRLLEEALAQQPQTLTMVRDLAAQNGALKATMRAALTVIDQAGGQR
jgi:transcriptional accessory protein Tex/SPT6